MSDEFAPLRGPEQCVGKRRFVSKAEVIAALHAIEARQHRRRRKSKARLKRGFPLAFYHCPQCRKWHLG